MLSAVTIALILPSNKSSIKVCDSVSVKKKSSFITVRSACVIISTYLSENYFVLTLTFNKIFTILYRRKIIFKRTSPYMFVIEEVCLDTKLDEMRPS